MKAKICEICGKIFMPKHCQNAKTCSLECRRIYVRQYHIKYYTSDSREARLTKTETIAKEYLASLGWSLERVTDYGYPDFSTKDRHTWFEIKSFGQSGSACVQENQINVINKLLLTGDTVFLVFVRRDDTVTCLKLNLPS